MGRPLGPMGGRCPGGGGTGLARRAQRRAGRVREGAAGADAAAGDAGAADAAGAAPSGTCGRRRLGCHRGGRRGGGRRRGGTAADEARRAGGGVGFGVGRRRSCRGRGGDRASGGLLDRGRARSGGARCRRRPPAEAVPSRQAGRTRPQRRGPPLQRQGPRQPPLRSWRPSWPEPAPRAGRDAATPRRRPYGGRGQPARPRWRTSGSSPRCPGKGPARALPCWSGPALWPAHRRGSSSASGSLRPWFVWGPGVNPAPYPRTSGLRRPHASPRCAHNCCSSSAPTGAENALSKPCRRTASSRQPSDPWHSQAPRPGP